MKRAIHYFDRIVIRQVLRLPDSVRPLMLFMTLLGQPPITVGLVAGMLGYGLARGSDVLIYAGCTAIITVAVASAMKIFLRRARPDNAYVRSMLIQTFSFPSGHAAGSLVCFGALGYVAAIYWPALFVPIAVMVIILAFLIGLSRVYLGAHYPSDVVGGWIVGGIGLAVIMILEVSI